MTFHQQTDSYFVESFSCFGEFNETLYERNPVKIRLNRRIYKALPDYSWLDPAIDEINNCIDHDIADLVIREIEFAAMRVESCIHCNDQIWDVMPNELSGVSGFDWDEEQKRMEAEFFFECQELHIELCPL